MGVALAAALFSTQSGAEENVTVFTYPLPHFWVKLDIIKYLLAIPVGYCQGPEDTPGQVTCHIERRGPGHYSGACNVELDGKPPLIIAGDFQPNDNTPHGPFSVPTLNFSAAGIDCRSRVPFIIQVQQWGCDKETFGVTCHWCWDEECYEGGFTVRQR